jgi:ribosomal protein S18 acetylase RimI-like enzyme
MQDLKIREFQKSDKPQIIELFFEFGEYLKKLDEKFLNLIIVPKNYGQRFYKSMLRDVKKSNGKIFIAEAEGKVAGFVAGVIFDVGKIKDEFDCKPHRMGRIKELFLNEKYRGNGTGKKLMDAMQSYFKENHCFKVNVEVFSPNANSLSFYKKYGFNERNVDLVKVI